MDREIPMDILEEAKQAVVFWEADNNYQVSIYTVENLIEEVEKLRSDERYAENFDLHSEIRLKNEENDSLTKERDALDKQCDEWQEEVNNRVAQVHWKNKEIEKLEAENAGLKKVLNELRQRQPSSKSDYAGNILKENIDLKVSLAKAEGMVEELGLWNRRAEFLRKLYTDAANDGRLTWDKIDKVVAENN